MRFTKLILTIILILSISFSILASDKLWQKAIEECNYRQNIHPGSIYFLIEELNGGNKVKSRDEVWATAEQGKDGKIKFTLVKAIKDDKDVTEIMKNEDDKESVEIPFRELNPFTDDVKKIYNIKRTSESKTINESKHIKYKFEILDNEDDVMVGTAWLDEKTGKPYEVVLKPKEIPAFMGKMNIKFYYESKNYMTYVHEIEFSLSSIFGGVYNKFVLDDYFELQ